MSDTLSLDISPGYAITLLQLRHCRHFPDYFLRQDAMSCHSFIRLFSAAISPITRRHRFIAPFSSRQAAPPPLQPCCIFAAARRFQRYAAELSMPPPAAIIFFTLFVDADGQPKRLLSFRLRFLLLSSIFARYFRFRYFITPSPRLPHRFRH